MSLKKGRVFVLNMAGHDFSKALRFTDEPLVVVTEGNVAVFNTDRLHYSLSKTLADFKEDDYLLMSGTPLLSLLAALVIKEKTNLERFNILLWSPSRREYVRRSIRVRGGDSGINP